MTQVKLKRVDGALQGTISLIGDKSISHRAVIFASLARGRTHITNLLESEDVIRTISAFQAMGVSIEKRADQFVVESNGMHHFNKPVERLYFGNSGTTARLMIGLLSGLPFESNIYGDSSLTKRPMDRVICPLEQMGASISSKYDDMQLPLTINGTQLYGTKYTIPVKSAQVKSALLLAGLFADGKTIVTEMVKTRNHTELMLKAFGGNVISEANTITVTPTPHLTGIDLCIPGDISSAAFWMVGALIIPNSHLKLKNVGLNHTRTGILDVLEKMGSNFLIEDSIENAGEKSGTLLIKHQPVKATTIDEELVPRLIDEIPIIALLATQAEGTTVIRGAEELRVKETDRIDAVVTVLSTLGANIKATEGGMVIKGKTELIGGSVSSYGDHRIAMMIIIASLISKREVIIDDISSVSISYPNFLADLKLLTKR